MSETAESIINSARSMWNTAKHGLNLIKSQDKTYLPTGIRNVLTFGREISRILQRLRSVEPEFDKWYKQYVNEMEKDPLLKYLYKLRNEVLKEGKMPLEAGVEIQRLNLNMINQLPRPPNAKAFFIGDKYGGSGWEVSIPDGTTGKFYISLPWDTVNVSTYFQDMPEEHLGKKTSRISVEQACEIYLVYLDNMINDAKKQFL